MEHTTQLTTYLGKEFSCGELIDVYLREGQKLRFPGKTKLPYVIGAQINLTQKDEKTYSFPKDPVGYKEEVKNDPTYFLTTTTALRLFKQKTSVSSPKILKLKKLLNELNGGLSQAEKELLINYIKTL